jgi:hypothetical protein
MAGLGRPPGEADVVAMVDQLSEVDCRRFLIALVVDGVTGFVPPEIEVTA